VPFFSTPSMTLLQETVEPERQGRVFGFVGIVMALAMPIGMVIFGPLADLVPIEWLLVGSGVLTFLVVGGAVAKVAAPAGAGEAANAAVAERDSLWRDGHLLPARKFSTALSDYRWKIGDHLT
jgi:DHA3 family macrolide efflux protein-like MFS transporter